jgi:beta-glucosidase
MNSIQSSNMRYFLALVVVLFYTVLTAQEIPYKNPNLSFDLRVNDLISRMTAEEKFRQLFMVAGELGNDSLQFKEGLFGFQINTVSDTLKSNNQMMQYAAGPNAQLTLNKINAMQRFFMEETRLGIPMIAFDEALHGLVRQGATAFPQSIAMAATFDTLLMNRVAHAIALESRARGLRMILSPVINLATDVRWGRVEETYGEDPYLSALFGVAYVRAMRQNGIVTTPKHFVVNHGDGGRDSYPIYWNERWMRETYFKPFKAVVQQGGAQSIMTAYNSFDGKPCTSNPYLLSTVLRKEWGFNGFVISDASATGGANVLHFTAPTYEIAGQQAIENGLDVIFQTNFSSYSLFNTPFLNGTTRQSAIDSAVSHVLRVKFELGLFDQPYQSDSLIQSLDLEKHRDLAYELALKSAVLLKNDQKTLPLNEYTKKIAVFGPDAVEARLGGYSGPGNNPVSILEGLKDWFHYTDVEYERGCERILVSHVAVPAAVLFHRSNGQLQNGLQASYFASMDLSNAPVVQRIDSQINFQWTLFGPDPKVPYDHFAAVWEGELIPTETGTFEIGIEGNDGYQLWLNQELVIDRSNDQSFHTTTVPFEFKEGVAVNLKIVYKEKSGNSWFKLIWNQGVNQNTEDQLNRAVKLAKKSEVALIVVGLEEGEFRDRSSLDLPGNQEELIKRVAATGTKTIVVIVGGSAVTMNNWIYKVDAIVDVWYPGEMGGKALTDLLTGSQNFSGRLPITFPKSVGQVPLNYNHPPTGRGDDYVGETGQALFPFGYGLSYTQFSYDSLVVSNAEFHTNDTVTLTFQVTNSGRMKGEEVVQLYVHDELASVVRPIKELKQFVRVSLSPGETKRVQMKVCAADFTFPNADLVETIEPGIFRIMIGASSKDIRLRTILNHIP